LELFEFALEVGNADSRAIITPVPSSELAAAHRAPEVPATEPEGWVVADRCVEGRYFVEAEPAKLRRPSKTPSASNYASMRDWSMTEEWWTTRQVCAYLKFGRKALWNMRGHPELGFPEPIDVAGNRHLYPGAEVRAWTERQRQKVCERASERGNALRHLSTKRRGQRRGSVTCA
jgi:predicted DNA-binding transcriptional regulator AlpA